MTDGVDEILFINTETDKFHRKDTGHIAGLLLGQNLLPKIIHEGFRVQRDALSAIKPHEAAVRIELEGAVIAAGGEHIEYPRAVLKHLGGQELKGFRHHARGRGFDLVGLPALSIQDVDRHPLFIRYHHPSVRRNIQTDGLLKFQGFAVRCGRLDHTLELQVGTEYDDPAVSRIQHKHTAVVRNEQIHRFRQCVDAEIHAEIHLVGQIGRRGGDCLLPVIIGILRRCRFRQGYERQQDEQGRRQGQKPARLCTYCLHRGRSRPFRLMGRLLFQTRSAHGLDDIFL